MNNKVLKLTLVLFLVCAVVAGILGGVYNITSERIAAQEAAKKAAAYNAVMASPGYTPMAVDAEGIDAIEKADNGAGYVVQTTFSGAQGSITMVVGVSNELKCTGISIIAHSETSGLGAEAASTSVKGENFRASFLDKDKTVTVKDIDAIAGATITSTAVTNAVVRAIEAVEALG